MLGRMGPKGRLVPSVHLFSVKLSLLLVGLHASLSHGFYMLKKPDNTKNRFPFVPQCPIFGKKRPQQPKSGGFAPIFTKSPKNVEKWQKMAKNGQKMAKKPDFSGFPENAENRRFCENRKREITKLHELRIPARKGNQLRHIFPVYFSM